ncbi:hypothetical protein NLG97_g9677 [Lecanicillium saksenae]|uniref:Uncharacterized protein n=1 Tax=Lecanicillium saksenae TaxID=468837 RepID=A0ACC1QH53_9HYPO|nr:hypothetical protein NLG97_g9677 [Lecanicillium saksenae]
MHPRTFGHVCQTQILTGTKARQPSRVTGFSTQRVKRGPLWDKVAICAKSAQVDAVAVVPSINALLVVDGEYLRWAGSHALVSVRPTVVTMEGDDAANVTFEVRKPVIAIAVHQLALHKNTLHNTALPCVEA